MPNLCEGCPRNCCLNFKITTELTDPKALQKILAKHPYIRKTGKDLVLFGSEERVVGVYTCDRFDPVTGECQRYYTQPRPVFCKNTGEEGHYPHKDCLLIKDKK